MSSREHILELARKLEKARNKSDECQVLSILQSLTNVNINIALLRESDLGKKVNTIRKCEAFKNSISIKQTAQTLVTKWKESVTAEKKKILKQKKTKNGVKIKKKNGKKLKLKLKCKSKSPSISPQTNENTSDTNTNTNTNKNSIETSTNTNTNDTNINGFIRESYSWQTGDSRRDNMISKFIAVMRPAPDCKEYIHYMKLAADIEAGLAEEYGFSNEKYIAKLRDLHYNLKKNGDLRVELLLGNMAISKLVRMSSEQLAHKSLKEKRDKDKQWAMEEARNDHGLDVSQAMTDEYRCGRCKERKCKYSQAQTRSADEPMTTFVTCLVCGNRWKF